MADTSFDCVVVGSGPGGYVAAIRASQLGMRAAVVERDELGGICLNWGCIPTKALLRASEMHHLLGELDAFGLSVGEVSFDLAKVVARSRKVAGRLAKGIEHLMKKNEISVLRGHARLAGPGRLAVEGSDGVSEVGAEHIVLATGARARTLPGLEPDGKLIWTYREAMVPDVLPRRLLVVGSGAIGVEFASFYRDLGCEVTIVEILPQILPAEDDEVAKAARRAFAKQGMEILTGTRVDACEARGDTALVRLVGEDGATREIEVDRVILAVGITGNVEDLGLEGTGVVVEKGHVVVDEWCRTGEPGIRAIGDLVGPPWLAHKASHEGVLCMEHIAGVEGVHPLDTTRVPGCTYCRPQIASIGLTERAAREAGHEVRAGKFPFAANGKAIALGDMEGFVKTVFDAATGELLGAHMIGPEVTEMVSAFAVALNLETTEAELMSTIFPHPTLSESMHEAVLATYGRALNY